LKIPREEICEPGTNKLRWKIAKKWLKPDTKIWDMMAEYEGNGSKEDDYTGYQCIPFIEKNLENISVEDVSPYNQVVAGRIISWVLNALRLRKGDITRRKALFRRAIELREEAIQKEAARKARLEVEIVDAENKYNEDHKEDMEAYLQYQQRSSRDKNDDDDDEDNTEREAAPVMPVFNKEEFLAKWLTDNPTITIPEEPVEEPDNDWILTPAELETLINTYFGRD
jgi:hypothetical protein